MHMQAIAQESPFAETIAATGATSRPAVWTGRILSGFAVLFLLVDSIGKLLRLAPYVAGTAQLGYPTEILFGLGLVELVCVLVYIVPRTSLLGAVLLTGYLGGAVASHVRLENPLLTHVLAPVYFAALFWGGLVLRDARLRAFLRETFPARRERPAPNRTTSANAESVMSEVRSKDGTAIAYERSGGGPALILVDGAFCSRAFGPMPKLAPLLAPHFTVYTYDRRGRGRSGDTQPYAREREIDDIAALIVEAGGSASLLGLSSGAGLSLEAAAGGLPIDRVMAYEPPYVDNDGQGGGAAHEAHLQRLLADGNRAGAVKYFMKDMVHVPAFVVAIMPLMPWIWRKLVAVAHTVPYDAAVMSEFRVPRSRFASIRVPVLVMHGSKTQPRLQDAARSVAGSIPGAQHRTLAGQTHNVNPAVLAPAVLEFVKR
jgi:pimeloyl-ACP methyl ester carboxylesterase